MSTAEDMAMWMFTPILAFVIFLVVAYLIYALGGAMGPKTEQSHHKLSTYACGEDIQGGSAQISFGFFHVAFIFTIFHVAVLIIAMIPTSDNAIYGLLFIGGLLIAAAALVTAGGESNA